MLFVLLAVFHLSAVESSAHHTINNTSTHIFQDYFKLDFDIDYHDGGNAVQSGTVENDLENFAVSFWVKTGSVSRFPCPFFQYIHEDYSYAIRLMVTDPDEYAQNFVTLINDEQLTSRNPGSKLKYSWRHLVVSWTNTNGAFRLWLDGKLAVSKDGYQTGAVIKKGGYFLLGANDLSSGKEMLSGTMAYLNVYDKFVNSTREVERLSNIAKGDEEAIVPWNSFHQNLHGEVRMMPELEIFQKAYIHLQCGFNTMTLSLAREGFIKYFDPEELTLLNSTCGASVVNSTHIVISTDLSECGTKAFYADRCVTFSNEVKGIQQPETSIKLECKYDYNLGTISIQAYAASVHTIDGKQVGRKRELHPTLALYRSSNFSVPFTKDQSPILVDSESTIYAEVAVIDRGIDVDNWINVCRLTAKPKYYDDPAYDVIYKGCPKKNVGIKFYDAPVGVKRFSFKSSKFQPGAVVYLHCNMVLCDPQDKESRCAKGLSICN